MPKRGPRKSGADRKTSAAGGRVEAAVPEGIHGTHSEPGVREIAGIASGCGARGGESARKIAGLARSRRTRAGRPEDRFERGIRRIVSQGEGKAGSCGREAN